MPSPRNKLTSKEVAELSAARDMRVEADQARAAIEAEMSALLEKIDADGAYRKLLAQRTVLNTQSLVADRTINAALDKVSKRIRAVGKKIEVNLATYLITVKE